VGGRALVVGCCLVLSGCAFWQIQPTPGLDIRSIHAALLPTGKVLLVEGSGFDAEQFAAGTFRSSIWDPADNSYSLIPTPYDMFCAGHAFLEDGRLLIAGGTEDYGDSATGEYYPMGSKHTYLFNPWTETYEAASDMTKGRWYPTVTALEDGRVLAMAGLDENRLGTNSFEVYDSGTGSWSAPVDAAFSLPLYPSMHLLEEDPANPGDTRLFFSGVNVFGTSSPPGIWDVDTNTFTPVSGLTAADSRNQGASVLLPPAQDQRVMVIGGGLYGTGTSTANVDIIDLDAPTPVYTAGPPISETKMYVLASILPDRTVLQAGGTDRDVSEPGTVMRYTAQRYDPVTNTWIKMPKSKVARAYHAESILLPDGRVALLGGWYNGVGETRIETLYPAYTSKTRPVVDTVPTEIGYGQPFDITFHHDGFRPINYVEIIRPSAATHAMDPDQRLVDLEFTQVGSTITATADFDGYLAPPGWYMLNIVDDRGVPSVSKWVHLT